MSGVLTLARYKVLNPATSLTDAQIRCVLNVAQSVAESLSGMVFGSEVGAVTNPSGTTYRIVVYGGRYDVGQQVRLVGGGVTATPFTITDTGAADSTNWIEVSSASAIVPTKVMPVLEHVGEASSGYVYVAKKPLFSVVSVKIKASSNQLWSDPSIQTVANTSFEVFQSGQLNVGVFLSSDALPQVAEGGQFLIKRMVRKQYDAIKVTYVAGFYSHVPSDLEGAICQLVPAIVGASRTGGVFASESHEDYSYQLLTVDQLGALPYAAVAVLRSYMRK